MIQLDVPSARREGVSLIRKILFMDNKDLLFQYTLRQGDNAVVMGHRLSEWCGHGPVLEQDIAITNIALDHVGQARMYLSYAGEVEGKGRSEDDLAYHRDVWDYHNYLLLEQPNGDWAQTIIRSFFYDTWHFFFLQQLQQSNDEQLAAIAAKALKEVTYHLRYSSEWTIRLGDGTEESHQRMQKAVDALWMYTAEFFEMDAIDQAAVEQGFGVDLAALKPLWEEKVNAILSEATLAIPASPYMQSGGRHKGVHTEHMGHILAEMQFVQRAYPGMEW
jgi:ring-1,2-phenylacetyl-CoA epoxidase subunit PaaC